jgi:Leucine-rich repeat (LRR) protein
MKIKNNEIARIVMFSLDRIENEFTTAELGMVTSLLVDAEMPFDEFSDLAYLTGLEDLELVDKFIGKDEAALLLKLENLTRLVFENCTFEDISFLKSLRVRTLTFLRQNIDYNFLPSMGGLNSLGVVGCNHFDLRLVQNLTNLKRLSLSYTNLINENLIADFTHLESIDLDSTKVSNLEFLLNFKNLKRLSVCEKQYEANRRVMETLDANGVEIFNENIMRF